MATGTSDVKLNAEQQRAVTHGDGPLLIVAGAGTGKTTVVTQRIFWLIQEKKVKPEHILALTFTEKAAEEMIERIDRALPYGYVALWASTFHAFCQRILQAHALDIGIPNDFRLCNTVDAWLLVRKNFDRFNLDYYRPLGNPTKFIHGLLKHFSRCKDEGIGPEEYLAYAKTVTLDGDSEKNDGLEDSQRIAELANAYHTYQQLLLEESALDFGDLLNYTLRLFRERPAIVQKYRTQFQYILVDEFQDTNWVQYELVKLLASPKNNITVVSDDDQAIYRWRGASYNNVVVFARDFPTATTVSLTTNYRSRQNILDCAYTFIQHNNPNRLEAQMAEGKTLLGVVTKKLIAARDGKAMIEHLQGTTEFDEARLVVQKILELRSANPKSETRNPKQIQNSKFEIPNWSDFCILVRANAMVAPFIRACEREGIPYHYLASRGLYAKPVVLDCVAYLRLLDNYHESTALYRILTSPVVALSHDDCVRLTHAAGKKNLSLYEAVGQASALQLSQEGITKCANIRQWITRHSALARRGRVSEVLHAFLEDSGYFKEIVKRMQHEKNVAFDDMERAGHLAQFFKRIAAFEQAEREPTVQHFLATFDYAIEAGEEGALDTDLASGPDAVKIMTIHSAKGLEFRYVFVVELVELRFPSVDRKDPIELPLALVKEIIPEGDAHCEEERRLFYVAMTRARDGLFFTSAEDYGGQRKKRPSSFLYEAAILQKQAKVLKEGNALSGGIAKQNLRAQLQTTQLSLPSQFSYTQLKAFETCPLQYKFAHIIKIPVRGKYTFNFGKSIHKALQQFFTRIMESQQKEQGNLFPSESHPPAGGSKVVVPPLEELLRIYEESWIPEWYESKKHEEEYYAKGKRMLRDLYALYEGKWPTPLALEQTFTIKLGEYTMKGAIDRIDRVTENGVLGVRIVDYKTGENVPKNDAAVDREQLYLYQIAVEETMQEKPIALQYYYLDTQRQFEFVGTEEEITAARERMRKTIDAIMVSDFMATPSPQKCKHCDFKEICEYRKL